MKRFLQYYWEIIIFILIFFIIFLTFQKVYASAAETIAPTGTVTYICNNTSTTVVITSNIKLKDTLGNGWTLSEDQKVYQKKYDKSACIAETKTVTIVSAYDENKKTTVNFNLDVNLDVDLSSAGQDLLLSLFWGKQTVYEKDGTPRLNNSDKNLNIENGVYASNDGITWKFLGMTPLKNRDASIIYNNGYFYVTGTASSSAPDTGEPKIEVYKSKDLVTWTEQKNAAYVISGLKNNDGSDKTKPLFYTNNGDSWVSSSVMTWGAKWFQDNAGNWYIVVSVTDTTVDYRTHNYFTPYIIPVTFTNSADLNGENIKFGTPISVELFSADGKTRLQKTGSANYSDEDDYGHIGINLFYAPSKKKYYLFTKNEATASGKKSQLQIYVLNDNSKDSLVANTTSGVSKWKQVTDNISWNSGESANICVDSTNKQYKSHFEGNYPFKLNSGKLLFITDHVANFKPETCDTSDGGMYYTTLSSFSTSGIVATNPKPLSILNTEMWKASYKKGYKITSDGSYLGPNVLRNATIYQVKDIEARNKIKKFATGDMISYYYNNGKDTVHKTISKNSDGKYEINISDIATNNGELTLNIVSTRPFYDKNTSYQVDSSKQRIPTGWTLQDDGITITKSYSKASIRNNKYSRPEWKCYTNYNKY